MNQDNYLTGIELMPTVRHVRLQDDDDSGMLGVYLISGQWFCCVLEPPDRGNRPNVSCVPEGQYTCVRYMSTRFGRELFKLTNVPFRSSIAIHSGRQVKHTEGCHLLGSHWDKLLYDRHLTNSGQTLENFMRVMRGVNRFHLTIVNAF